MTINNTALITGASGGIGLALAKIHAKTGGDLVIIARSQDKLTQIKQEFETTYGITVTVIAKDLSQPNAAEFIFARTKQLNIQIDTLINNAGFGGHGKFYQRNLSAEQEMIQVNITALTDLTHFYLKGMVARKQGKILNVSSTASFMPGPLQAVYYATKAYVTSFSQAISEEVAEHNVTVTTLCPGTVNTGFVEAGDLVGVDAWKNAKSPESVAIIAYQDMMKGKLLSFNESMLKFVLTWIIPLLPNKTVLKLSRQVMEKNN